MQRRATGPAGAVAFATFLLGIPILAGGVWLSTSASDCVRFLQLPLITLGVALMAVSLFGLSAACYARLNLLRFFLFLLFLFLFALLFFVVFAYATTDSGQGQPLSDRAFLEYRLADYSGWIKDRLLRADYWDKVAHCVSSSGDCGLRMARYARDPASGLLLPESADAFYQRNDLSPIQVSHCLIVLPLSHIFLHSYS